MRKGKLGILGGMGPQATLMFYQRVIDATAASSDQAHIETMILSDTQMPDRTAALLSGQTEPVVERLLRDARQLEEWGAACIAVPCNTSHAFLPRVQEGVEPPIINMIGETAKALATLGAKKVGIMGTDGTIRMGLYHAACQEAGMEVLTPNEEHQGMVMDIIYGEIKQGKPGSEDKFQAVAEELFQQGCDHILLACTELSVYRDWHGLDERFVDPMDVMARVCVERCGYPLRNNDEQ